MEEIERRRASRVCRVCALRKKTCDKALPSCGFCSSRGLQCEYEEPALGERRNRNYNPGRHFIPIAELEPVSQVAVTARQPVSQQVSQLLQLMGLNPQLVGQRYFYLSSQWPPVISPEFFATTIHHSADSAILHLAMAMIAIFPDLPKSGSEVHQRISRVQLYTSVKSIFGQAQASISTSLLLVQAGLLIATCEYVCGMPNTAYITLATCSAMMQVLRMDDKWTKEVGQTPDTFDTTNEFTNVRWAMSMLERIIISEMPRVSMASFSENPATMLPPDQPRESVSGRQAEAIIFLDRVLSTTRSLGSNSEKLIAELGRLDLQLRSFLTLIIAERENPSTASAPGSIPLAVRALFLLHFAIINHLIQDGDGTSNDRTLMEASRSTLDMVSQMAIDLAKYRREGGHVPICCYYNLTISLDWLRKDGFTTRQRPPQSDIDLLPAMLDQYRTIWMMQ